MKLLYKDVLTTLINSNGKKSSPFNQSDDMTCSTKSNKVGLIHLSCAFVGVYVDYITYSLANEDKNSL